MTQEQAKKEQERLAGKYTLGWWFGTNCEKCCDVYPRFRKDGNDNCYYECDVCGKRTEPQIMPWLAQQKWNEHEYKMNQQIRFC